MNRVSQRISQVNKLTPQRMKIGCREFPAGGIWEWLGLLRFVKVNQCKEALGTVH